MPSRAAFSFWLFAMCLQKLNLGSTALDPFTHNYGLLLKIYGEPVGIRTRDLLIKSQLLYRLSYGLYVFAQSGLLPRWASPRRLRNRLGSVR